MTDKELKRLDELDEIIAWNNPTDGGRPLTEEERQEHKQLFFKFMHEHEQRKAQHEEL